MSALRIEPATPERLADLEDLFGAKGACGGCWCQWWRLPRAEFVKGKGEPNRLALRRQVEAGPPGVLAYRGEQAVGWCAVAPRADYPRLARSRTLAAVDEQPVWSISCLFVRRGHRQQGVSEALVRAACAFAAQRGARLVEAYPIDPRGARTPDAFAWTGLLSAYERAGFAEVARRSESRPIVRWSAP